jgi:hypothetical protein
MTIINFFNARSGGYEAFDFKDFVPRIWSNVYITTGTGSSLGLVDCDAGPGTVYVDGVAQVPGTDYTVSLTGGTNGRNGILFIVPPSAGQVVTTTISGATTRYFRVRFEDDSIRATSTQQYAGTEPYHEFKVNLISQRP